MLELPQDQQPIEEELVDTEQAILRAAYWMGFALECIEEEIKQTCVSSPAWAIMVRHLKKSAARLVKDTTHFHWATIGRKPPEEEGL